MTVTSSIYLEIKVIKFLDVTLQVGDVMGTVNDENMPMRVYVR